MKHLLAIFILFFIVQGWSPQAHSMSMIRDAEIENAFATWFGPVAKAAGMAPGSVNILIVNDPQINAFVAGGSNVFFYTGLLIKTENVGEVIGVFAHELGHIVGGHLIKSREVQAQSAAQALVSTLVGIGAALLGGSEAAGAAIQTGQAVAASHFLSHSRIQESSADQAGISYLENAGMNPAGFKTFLQKLESQELLPASQQVEYARTHPVTRNRIDAVENRISEIHEHGHADKDYPAAWHEAHTRMKAKLIGFLHPNRVTLYYPEEDHRIAAEYARAIADYRLNNTEKALQRMAALLKAEPKNPYFYELIGQIHKDRGEVEKARRYYKEAVDHLPNSSLLLSALAHVMIEGNQNKKGYNEAINLLKRAVQLEPHSRYSYRLLASAYNKIEKPAHSALYAAEEALLGRNTGAARRHVEIALKDLPRSSTEYIRAKDILKILAQAEQQKSN